MRSQITFYPPARLSAAAWVLEPTLHQEAPTFESLPQAVQRMNRLNPVPTFDGVSMSTGPPSQNAVLDPPTHVQHCGPDLSIELHSFGGQVCVPTEANCLSALTPDVRDASFALTPQVRLVSGGSGTSYGRAYLRSNHRPMKATEACDGVPNCKRFDLVFVPGDACTAHIEAEFDQSALRSIRSGSVVPDPRGVRWRDPSAHRIIQRLGIRCLECRKWS